LRHEIEAGDGASWSEDGAAAGEDTGDRNRWNQTLSAPTIYVTRWDATASERSVLINGDSFKAINLTHQTVSDGPLPNTLRD
jgi:hypothetical protein